MDARYRNAAGDSWDGRGEIPRWLRQAASAGQSVQHFGFAPTGGSAALVKSLWTGKKTILSAAPLSHTPTVSRSLWRN
ncbi:H-NS family nucleoid-associated regulatory protein [Paraburkholderia sediminicola]|uniref:H-NS family nucleoid-associated regulatory protein n=1 Tax=Paraburkholderia sediminicola TaxID=458836 RepID=UPI0038B7DBE9